MGENSGIAWTDHTFNPWIGCMKISSGCDHCYAEAWDERFNEGGHWGTGAPRRRTSIQNWNKVRRWEREAAASGTRPRVFCASLADVFDNEVPDNWRSDLWQLIAETPHLDWILVTKRIGNVARMAPAGGFGRGVILLVTIVNQPEANRDVPKLLALKRDGIIRLAGVSYEPALGLVDWCNIDEDASSIDALGGSMFCEGRNEPVQFPALDWLIVGGESSQGGARARLFDVAWARSSIEQCRSAGVPVFVKQMGSFAMATFAPGCDHFLHHEDRAGADPSEWPADLRVRQFPVIGGGS